MLSKYYSPWIIIYIFVSILYTDIYGQTSDFVVNDFGAISDGKTDSRKAFMSAWSKACQTKDGKMTILPGNYFLSVADFEGPCNGQTHFTNAGILNASSNPSTLDYWIRFINVDGLILSGNGGVFDGNGESVWGQKITTDVSSRKQLPSTLRFQQVTNSFIQNITLVNSKMFHISLFDSHVMRLNNLSISAPGNSPNTDGIHIGYSDHINITNSHIATGDDCIGMVEGCSDININSITCGPGHGISIGSLGKIARDKDLSRITVTKSIFTNTENGVRIKTFAPSLPSIVSDINFAHIVLNNVTNPIIIDQHYCPSSNCHDQGESSVQIKRVKYVDIRGSSTLPVAVNVNCSKSRPCQDIEFSGLNIKFQGKPTTATCSNSDVRFQGSSQVPAKCSS